MRKFRENNGKTDKRCVEIGIVVRNLEEACKKLSVLFDQDIPPAIEMELTDVFFHGEPCKGQMRLAFYEYGGTFFKLIEPDAKPSTFREFLDMNGEGIHHICMKTLDLDSVCADWKAKGVELIQSQHFLHLLYPDIKGRGAFFNTTDWIKTNVELVEFDEKD